MLFSMLSRKSLAVRAASGDDFEYWISRPRSSLKRSSQNGSHEIALGLELRDRQQPLRRAGMAGHEHGFLSRAPAQLNFRCAGVAAGLPFS